MPLFASVKDVQDRLPELPITGESKPTTLQVETMLAGVCSEIMVTMPTDVRQAIDASLANLTPDGVFLLRNMAAIGTVVQVWASAFGSSAVFGKIELWQTEYRDFLKNLANGRYTLIVTNITGGEGVLRVGKWRLQTPEDG